MNHMNHAASHILDKPRAPSHSPQRRSLKAIFINTCSSQTVRALLQAVSVLPLAPFSSSLSHTHQCPPDKSLTLPHKHSLHNLQPALTYQHHNCRSSQKMSSFNLRSAGQMLLLYISLVGLTLANRLITSINPVSSTNLTDQLRAGYYAIPMTDDKGNVHDMIISTVSLDSWFATTASTCPGTPNPDPKCGWNPNALYDPTGASTDGTYCSIGVKSPVNQYTECYSIMPNISITLGDNIAQNPDLLLYANVGLLLNSTWDGSQQSGMLGLAASIDYGPTGPWNSILADISTRYSQSAQFTLAFKGGPETGGWFTVGDALPPDALPLTDPSVFQTPMENATFNGRANNLYVVTAGLAIVTAPNIPEQYSESSALQA